jgi:hypothetical protein
MLAIPYMADSTLPPVRRGRKPRSDRPSRRRLQIRMTEEEWVALHAIATLNLSDLSEFARDAINEAVEDCGERRVFQRRRAAVPVDADRRKIERRQT